MALNPFDRGCIADTLPSPSSPRWATHHNTWEPRSNLNNLHEEIEAFERSLSDSRALNG